MTRGYSLTLEIFAQGKQYAMAAIKSEDGNNALRTDMPGGPNELADWLEAMAADVRSSKLVGDTQ